MYGDILIPLDGSSFSERALPYAGAIARRAGARLHLVFVHTPLAGIYSDIAPVPPTSLMQDWEERHRRTQAQYLEATVDRLREQGIDAFAENLDGDVAHELIRRAGSEADLLVMATHGRAGLERAWLGSVAEEVVHHVRLPVILVRPPADGEPPPESEPAFDHILIATDGSAAAAAATAQATEFAGLFGSRLTLLRIVSVPAGLSSPYIPHAALLDREVTERREDEARAQLKELAAGLAGALRVETQVRVAYHPARGILEAISEIDCDLVALGTHRRARLSRVVLGSVADKVVRASPLPVLIGHADG